MQPKNDVCFFLVVVHNVLLSLVISRQSVSCSDCSGCSHHSSQTPLFHCLLVPATLFTVKDSLFTFQDSLFTFQESLFTFQDSLFTFQDSLPNSIQLQETSTHQWISNDPNYGWHHHQLFESLMISPHHEYPIPPCCHLLTKNRHKILLFRSVLGDSSHFIPSAPVISLSMVHLSFYGSSPSFSGYM